MAVGKPEEEPPLQKGGPDDCSSGPVKNRGCTDILCCVGFIAHWVFFVMLFALALSEGDPARLTSHRDFKGAYCGQKDNWEPWNEVKNGPRFNMKGYEKLAYTMNMEGFMEMMNIDRQICQQALAIPDIGFQALSGLGFSLAEFKTARDTTANCPLVVTLGAAGGSLSKMTDPDELKKQAVDLFAGGGIMDMMDKYFHSVCVKSCSDVQAFGESQTGPMLTSQIDLNAKRAFVYTPKPDKDTYDLYRMMNEIFSISPALVPIMAMTVSTALPRSICPEDPQYCVPFPGLAYDDVANLCLFSLGVGIPDPSAAVSGAMENSAAGNVVADFGTMVGDIATAWPAVALVAFLSLVIGFLFMVFLRFAVGYIVWGSIFLQFALLAGAAGYFFMMTQCEEKTVDVSTATSAPAVFTPSNSTTPGGNSTRVLEETFDAIQKEVTESDALNQVSDSSVSVGVASAAVVVREFGTHAHYGLRHLTSRRLQTASKTVEECEEPDETMRDMYLYLCYFFCGLAGLYLLWVFCMCSRIKLGVAINKVAATFVYQNKMVVFVPCTQMLVALIYWLIWAVAALHLVSQVSDDALPKGPFNKDKALGTPIEPGECNGAWPAGDAYVDVELIGKLDANEIYRDNSVTNTECSGKGLQRKCYRCSLPRWAINPQFAFAFFSLLWNNAFIIAVGQCTLAGAVAFWYFTPNEKKGTTATIRPALTNCFRYHGGSLAFGAFILAVVQFIKWTLYYIQKQAEQQKNFVMVKIAKCLQCCIQCVERFIKFLNKNAYIQIAILGKNFCKSAWNAFCLILRNAGRIGALGMIGGMVKYIGLAFITGGTTIIGYFLLIAMYEDDISSPAMPMLVFFLIGYVNGNLFMNVFAMGVDATLQCFVADEELNKSGDSKCTPEELKAFLKDSKGGCC